MLNYLIAFILIVLSALFSGLTLGLMGLSPSELKRKASLGDSDAEKVYKIRKNGNLLLTTLLVGNVAVNTTLSIFLGSVISGFTGGIIATGLIVVAGEIAPQALFSRYALSLGARASWFVLVISYLLYPVSKPIAMMLDKLLGEELPAVYSKQELVKIIEEHEDEIRSEVDEDEERIVKGALTFSDKKVKDIMTLRENIESLEITRIIDSELLAEIRESSHSRIPVYKEKLNNIVGMLYIRDLVGSASGGQRIGDVADEEFNFVSPEAKLDETLKAFLRKKIHLFVVKDSKEKVVGVVSLEDILEEIIKREIIDEDD